VSKDSQLWWRVIVSVPRSLPALRSLSVSTQIFKVSGSLPSTLISDVEVRSTSASINLGMLNAKAARVKTTNGEIKGEFNISRSLSLTTSNGAIDAKVSLFAPTLEDRKLSFPKPPPPPQADRLRSDIHFDDHPYPGPHHGPHSSSQGGDHSGSDKHVDERISFPPHQGLHRGPPPGFPPVPRMHLPKFYRRWLELDAQGIVYPTVIASTSNGAVDLEYVHHPAGLGLHSFVQTTNGRAHVIHLPAYEGDFEVSQGFVS
jgi:hypothetical protein